MGVPMLQYRKEYLTASIRNPLKNFELTEDQIEIRWDPLLGSTSRISASKGLDKIPDGSPLQEFVEKSNSCFFCRGNVETKTPLLPESIDATGRVEVGEALVFPNLSGFGTFSGVCIFSKDHFIAIQDFTEIQIFQALKACRIFLSKCAGADSRVLYPSLNGNYLLPAGSSILHPHLQPFLDPFPTNVHRQLLENSQNFRKENQTSFWTLLRTQERKSDRFLFESANCFFHTPFAPSGFCEIDGIIGDGIPYLDLDDRILQETSRGIRRILQFYHSMQHNSFNLTLFSPPVPVNDHPAMPCLLKICTRPVFTAFYRNDVTFFEKFHGETMIDQAPEETAARFREFHTADSPPDSFIE